MSTFEITVNGTRHAAEAEPRTHLADFLRESLLLTGTHLGCEHGVCGACTVLLNGEPARSCITYAAMCDGAEVCSIEGLEDDPGMVALRAAFTAEHALQCGYCTPGMLVTARDIVMRLPDADDDQVRLELSGNLCRCTGYNGIVKAIRRVLDAKIATALPARPALAALAPAVVSAVEADVRSTAVAATMPDGQGLHQSLHIGLPPDVVWAAIQDPALVAGCVPGARLTGIAGGVLSGEMVASLGPIQARFAGTATLQFDPTSRSGRLAGEGRDGGTRLSGTAVFRVRPDSTGTVIELDITYALRGPLAQFSRGPIVQVFASEIVTTVAGNLEARLLGTRAPAPRAFGTGGLFLRVVWRALRRLLNRDHV